MSITEFIDIDLQSALEKVKYLIERLYEQNNNIPKDLELSEKRIYSNSLFDRIENTEEMLDILKQLKKRNEILSESSFCNIDIEGLKIKMEPSVENITDIEKFIELSLDEIKKLKIRGLVRYIIEKLIYDKKLSKLNISNLQNYEWCKDILLVSYPVIRKYNKYLTESDQRKVNGTFKYYAQIYKLDESEYFICSELAERSRQPFLQWFWEKYNTGFKSRNLKQSEANDKIKNVYLIHYDSNVSKNINSTFDKPCRVVIFDSEYIVTNWSEIIPLVCENMISSYPTDMTKIVNESRFKLKDGSIFSTDPTVLVHPKKLSNGLYVQKTFSPEKIVYYCYSIIYYCQVDRDKLKIFCCEDEKKKIIEEDVFEEDNYDNNTEKMTLRNVDSNLVNEFIKILDNYNNPNNPNVK